MSQHSTAAELAPVMDITDLQDTISLKLLETHGIVCALSGDDNNFEGMDVEDVAACLLVVSTKLSELKKLVNHGSWVRLYR